MGYRRDSSSALVWKRWKQAHAKLILASGISTQDVENENAWWDYLEHEVNIPRVTALGYACTAEQINPLRHLVLSWPGGGDTMLGKAFVGSIED